MNPNAQESVQIKQVDGKQVAEVTIVETKKKQLTLDEATRNAKFAKDSVARVKDDLTKKQAEQTYWEGLVEQLTP